MNFPDSQNHIGSFNLSQAQLLDNALLANITSDPNLHEVAQQQLRTNEMLNKTRVMNSELSLGAAVHRNPSSIATAMFNDHSPNFKAADQSHESFAHLTMNSHQPIHYVDQSYRIPPNDVDLYEPIAPTVYSTYDTRGEISMVKPASPARTLPIKTLAVEPSGA